MAFYYSSRESDQITQITVFTLDFHVDKQQFFSLIRASTQPDFVRYSITTLNQEMDEVFVEPYFLHEKKGVMQIDAMIENTIESNVKFASIVALRNYLVQDQSADIASVRFIA